MSQVIKANFSIKTTQTARANVHAGTKDALIAAGLVTESEFTPQPGRSIGLTCFMGDGSPAATTVRGCTDEGFKSVRLQRDGSYEVSINVSRDEQSRRRAKSRAELAEEREARLNEELAKRGPELANWKLEKEYSTHGEYWDGTKAQLQSIGLCVGMAFPGESGAPKNKIFGECPLGYRVEVRAFDYDNAKRAAGIFRAYCAYDQGEKKGEEFVAYATGVVEQLTPYPSRTFFGSATDLVAAGLAPDLSHFPGLGGNVSKTRFTWNSGGRKFSAQRRGKGQFELTRYSTDDEWKAHCEKNNGWRAREDEQSHDAIAKRRRERGEEHATSALNVSAGKWESTAREMARHLMDMAYLSIFPEKDEGFKFDISDEDKAEMLESFRFILETLGEARVVSTAKPRLQLAHSAPVDASKVASARSNASLQNMLRLVQSGQQIARGAK